MSPADVDCAKGVIPSRPAPRIYSHFVGLSDCGASSPRRIAERVDLRDPRSRPGLPNAASWPGYLELAIQSRIS